MSQFHKHFKIQLKDKVRNYVLKFLFKNISSKAYILWGSKLLRFPRNIMVGPNTIIKHNVSLCSCNERAEINIGSGCTVGDYSYIYSSQKITIGNNCLIGPFAYLVDSDHSIDKGTNIREQPLVKKTIKLGDDIWLGARVTILGGVNIDDGAVIAAGSVVKNNVGKNEIWAGVPAKKIGERN